MGTEEIVRQSKHLLFAQQKFVGFKVAIRAQFEGDAVAAIAGLSVVKSPKLCRP